jgi:molecular chaperone DnaK (HSP70)
MPYVLGVHIGGSNAFAAVCRRAGEGWAVATAAPLGTRSTAIESTLLVSAAGEPAPRDGSGHDRPGEPHRSIRGYIRRVGDDVPFMIGNVHYPAHELTATMIRWIVDRVWAVEGEPAEQVMFARPAGWGPHREGLLRDALRSRGLTEVMFIAAPLAAAAGHTAGGEPPTAGVFAVYDLGDSGFTGSVVERHNSGAMEVIGSVDGQVGGADLDDALVAHVEARAVLTRHARQDGTAGRDGTAGDPNLRISTMAWLRSSCGTARKRLSAAVEAVVPVPTSGGQIDVVVTRAEFAELVRPLLQPTVDSLARLVRAVAEPTDPAAVLLAGEATHTPGLDGLIAAQLPVPVLSDPHPDSIVARGAALAARRVVARTRAAVRSHGAWGQA